ncbi:MAG: AI-2E family transporter [Burkholderiaceae bacterium]
MNEVLSPFFTAFIIAYLLEPITRKLSSYGISRTLASLISILVGTIILSGIISLVVPIIDNEIDNLKLRLPSMISNGFLYIEPIFSNYLNIQLDSVENIREQILEWLRKYSGTASKNFFSMLISGTNLFFNIIGWMVLLPVVIFYLLRDWNKVFPNILEIIPKKNRDVTKNTLIEANDTLKNYLHGQALVITCMSIYYTSLLLIAGYESWFSLGLLSGILVFLPYVGFAFSVILVLLSGLLELGPLYSLISVLLIYGLGQVIEGFFLTPKLVGDKIGLHPLAVIFSLMFFGTLFGFLGLLVALPIASILIVVGEKILTKSM